MTSKKTKQEPKLTPRQRLVLEYVRAHGRANTQELRSAIKDTMSLVYSAIHTLTRLGLVRPVHTFGTLNACDGKIKTARMLVIELKEK